MRIDRTGPGCYEIGLTHADVPEFIGWLVFYEDAYPLIIDLDTGGRYQLNDNQAVGNFYQGFLSCYEQLMGCTDRPPVFMDGRSLFRVTGTQVPVIALEEAWREGKSDGTIMAEHPELTRTMLDAVWSWTHGRDARRP